MKINIKNIYHENQISWDNFCVEEINIYCGRPKDEERIRMIEFYRNLLIDRSINN